MNTKSWNSPRKLWYFSWYWTNQNDQRSLISHYDLSCAKVLESPKRLVLLISVDQSFIHKQTVSWRFCRQFMIHGHLSRSQSRRWTLLTIHWQNLSYITIDGKLEPTSKLASSIFQHLKLVSATKEFAFRN